MIYITYNLLNDSDYQKLNEVCVNFDNFEHQKHDDNPANNSYNRVMVNNLNLNEYFDNLNNFLKYKISNQDKLKVTELSKPDSWINKVIPETNKSDKFHSDFSTLTAVTYFNDNFDGGFFQYKDDNGKIQSIKPKKNMTLIMDEELQHRVMPVTYGVRFSLVSFFQLTKKEKKTLL
jgi:predicted 2-oxoglutarate/Fe(II)-dependent dioxygenase YbiX